MCPFVDPLTSILDPSLPLTVIEWEEWGNPLDDPEVYAYMKAYTPYENVEAKRYPPILAETSLNDTRVLYVEPAKWVAGLRRTAANGDDVLLKTEMSAGHGGVSGRYNALARPRLQPTPGSSTGSASPDASLRSSLRSLSPRATFPRSRTSVQVKGHPLGRESREQVTRVVTCGSPPGWPDLEWERLTRDNYLAPA